MMDQSEKMFKMFIEKTREKFSKSVYDMYGEWVKLHIQSQQKRQDIISTRREKIKRILNES